MHVYEYCLPGWWGSVESWDLVSVCVFFSMRRRREREAQGEAPEGLWFVAWCFPGDPCEAREVVLVVHKAGCTEPAALH